MWIARRNDEGIMRGRPATHPVVLRAVVKHQVCWLVASADAPSSTRIPSIEGDVSKAIEAATTILRASVRRHRSRLIRACFGRSDRSAQATADLSEVGSLASEGGGDEDGQGVRLAGQETRGGGEDPGEERLSRHTGSLLEDG